MLEASEQGYQILRIGMSPFLIQFVPRWLIPMAYRRLRSPDILYRGSGPICDVGASNR